MAYEFRTIYQAKPVKRVACDYLTDNIRSTASLFQPIMVALAVACSSFLINETE